MYVVALELLLFVDALVQDFSGLGIYGESCFLLLNVGGDGCGVRRFRHSVMSVLSVDAASVVRLV
jgi:hypothetical protein